jgi:hypothetical protein
MSPMDDAGARTIGPVLPPSEAATSDGKLASEGPVSAKFTVPSAFAALSFAVPASSEPASSDAEFVLEEQARAAQPAAREIPTDHENTIALHAIIATPLGADRSLKVARARPRLAATRWGGRTRSRLMIDTICADT